MRALAHDAAQRKMLEHLYSLHKCASPCPQADCPLRERQRTRRECRSVRRQRPGTHSTTEKTVAGIQFPTYRACAKVLHPGKTLAKVNLETIFSPIAESQTDFPYLPHVARRIATSQRRNPQKTLHKRK